jgi:hypothetical protein
MRWTRDIRAPPPRIPLLCRPVAPPPRPRPCPTISTNTRPPRPRASLPTIRSSMPFRKRNHNTAWDIIQWLTPTQFLRQPQPISPTIRRHISPLQRQAWGLPVLHDGQVQLRRMDNPLPLLRPMGILLSRHRYLLEAQTIHTGAVRRRMDYPPQVSCRRQQSQSHTKVPHHRTPQRTFPLAHHWVLTCRRPRHAHTIPHHRGLDMPLMDSVLPTMIGLRNHLCTRPVRMVFIADPACLDGLYQTCQRSRARPQCHRDGQTL